MQAGCDQPPVSCQAGSAQLPTCAGRRCDGSVCLFLHVRVQVSELGGGQNLAGLCDLVVRTFDEAGLLLPVSAGLRTNSC